MKTNIENYLNACFKLILPEFKENKFQLKEFIGCISLVTFF